MTKMTVKRSIVLIFICFLLSIYIFPSGVNTFAIDNGKIKLEGEQLDNYISKCALEWAELVEPELDLIIGDIIKINIADSNQIEYCASYFCDTVPYGYAVLYVDNDDLVIKEGWVSPWKEGIYTELVDIAIDSSSVPYSEMEISQEVVEIAPMQYAISTQNKKYKNKKAVYNSNGQILNDVVLPKQSDVYSDSGAIFIQPENWKPQNYKVDDSTKIILKQYQSRSILYKNNIVKLNAKKYACVVQSMLQIGYLGGLYNYDPANINELYNKFWNYSNTTPTGVIDSSYNAVIGKTYTGDGARALVRYAKEIGYSGTEFKGMTNGPSVSWIKDKLQYNRAILMDYDIYYKDNNGNTKIAGHAITVLGYMKAKKVSSGNTWNYLMVYDGWNQAPRYINYSTVDFINCSATYFWFKK